MLEPFSISVPDSMLTDLHRRLLSTRLIPDSGLQAWEDGTPPSWLRLLVDHWRDRFDWRLEESRLNSFHHLRGDIDGTTIHCIHQKGLGPNPLPLLLIHGYPDSFWRFHKVIPMLTDPASYGADPVDAFHVVAPSLPGYGWSGVRTEGGGVFGFGGLFAKLMAALGYERYGAHGGDWGSTIVESIAQSHSGRLAGIHLTDVPFLHAFQKPDNLSHAETRFLAAGGEFQKNDGAYAMIQGTRPATLANALVDSPAGLAAWIAEKFYEWSDCGGDIESRFTKDELLTNITIYWVTGTIGSSFLPYRDFLKAGATRWMKEGLKKLLGSNDTPAAFALFPKDILTPPREWAERFFNVVRWTEMPRGGHFAALEEPGLLVEDLRTFFRSFR